MVEMMETKDTLARNTAESKVSVLDKGVVAIQAPNNSDSVIPEETVNIFSRWSYSWMDSLFRIGMKRPLQMTDVWHLGEQSQAEYTSGVLQNLWIAEQAEALAQNRAASFSTCVRKFTIRPLLWAGFLRFCDFSYIFSPFLIKYLVNYVARSQAARAAGLQGPTIGEGLGYTFGIFLFSITATFLQNRYYQIANIQGVKVRSALTSMIYQKAIRLSAASRQNFSSGKVTTLVSTDVNRIDMFLQMVNQIWVFTFLIKLAPLQIVVILAFLITAIGPAALAGVGVLILASPIQKTIFSMLAAIRSTVAPLTDERVKTTQEVLSGIRVIKFFTWETPFEEQIESIRVKEIKQVLKRALLNSFVMTMAFAFPILASTISFTVYSVTQPSFDPANLFSALAWFAQLRFPLMFLPSILTQFAEYKVAIRRIQEMLDAGELESLANVVPDASFAVQVTDGEFIWESAPKMIGGKTVLKNNDQVVMDDVEAEKSHLTDINFSIPKGSLVAIVGTVGSGKSTLLNSLIGETKRLKGSVVRSGNTGYAAQQAWIKNASIKDNILFGHEYNRTRYLKAIRDCALEPDLAIFEDGDLTSIGEKGINLSGGQKQRINLARLVYYNADISLMDDPLSAVDAHVGKHLFDRCINGALKDKTRILVTHQLHFLPEVDYILVMKDGKVAEQGTYKSLLDANGEFSKLIRDYGEGDEKEKIEATQDEIDLLVTNDADDIARIGKLLDQKHEVTARNLMNDEERIAGHVSVGVWITYMNANGGYPYLFFLLLFLCLTQAARIGTDFWLVIWTNQEIPSFNQGEYIATYFGWSVLQTIVFYGTSCYFAFTGTRAATILHSAALKRIMCAPISFFDTTPMGRILNRFSKDQDGVDTSLMDAIRMFCITLSTCLAIFVLIIYATPMFAIALAPILVVYYFVQRIYRSVSIELKRLDSISRSPLYSQIGETLTGLSTIRAYGEESRFVDVNMKLINYNMAPAFLLTVAGRWLGLRLEILGSVLVFFASLFGVLARNLTSFTPALFGISLSYALQVTGTMNWCIRQFTEVENAMNAVERIAHYGFKIVQEAPAIQEHNRPAKDWPHKGTIEFKNIDLRYAPKLPLVLSDVTFTVKENEKIGICGRTGSGKSTLIQALFRMVEPARGTIAIDGVVAQDIGLKDLRSKISIIPQDPVLFSGSFRRNLDPFNDYADIDIWVALDRARMKKKVTETGGLEGKVTEGGENLSVGERQLICLARAMLCKPKILVMDEATANVDFESDSIIQQCLREDLKNATILTIAHRLNTIVDYDRVLVMDNGRVAEFDTPKNLIAANGIFRSMVENTGAQCLELYMNL